MTENTWHIYLVSLASREGLTQRPAIRHLYYAGWTVPEISEAAHVDIGVVRDCLHRIP